MTPAQDAALKTALLASSDQALQAAISGGNDTFVAEWCNTIHSPDYWVWKTTVSRAEVYNTTSPTGSAWDWTVYKGQAVAEQNAWVQMFMGDVTNFANVNLRAGIGKIFTGSNPANAQRDHCLAMGRRLANRSEKLLAVAVVNPPTNSGNNSADARGATTNPDLLTIEGNISSSDIARILRG